jgi:hypothetical protein
MDLLEADSTLFCSLELEAEDVATALTKAKNVIGSRRVFIFQDGKALDTIHL